MRVEVCIILVCVLASAVSWRGNTWRSMSRSLVSAQYRALSMHCSALSKSISTHKRFIARLQTLSLSADALSSGQIPAESSSSSVRPSLTKDFYSLSDGKQLLEWIKFVNWEDLRMLVAQGICTRVSIGKAWAQTAGHRTFINADEFIAIMCAIDPGDAISILRSRQPVQPSKDKQTNKWEGNPWSPSANVTRILGSDFTAYLTHYFNSVSTNSSEGRILTYDKVAEWEDVKYIMNEKRLDPGCLKPLWLDAVKYWWTRRGIPSNIKEATEEDSIGLEAYLRFCIQLNQIFEDVEIALRIEEDDERAMNRKIFRALTPKRKLLSYSETMDSPPVSSILERGKVTQSKMDVLWTVVGRDKLPGEDWKPDSRGVCRQGAVGEDSFVRLVDAAKRLEEGKDPWRFTNPKSWKD